MQRRKVDPVWVAVREIGVGLWPTSAGDKLPSPKEARLLPSLDREGKRSLGCKDTPF